VSPDDPVEAPGSVGPPRLDKATLTVSLYPECGEASIVKGFQESRPREARPVGIRGAALDPEKSRAASLARTRRQVRRWCTAHKATRLATLTFADEPDLDGGWEQIEDFRRALDAAGIPQPLIVPQYGSEVGRLHFHCAMPTYVPKHQLERLWPHGFVDVRRISARSKQGGRKLGGREQARIAACYVSAYVTKQPVGATESPDGCCDDSDHASPDRSIAFNRRRYSVPKGTNPQPVRFTCIGDLHDAWTEIQRQCGFPMFEVWRSPVDDPEWRGPPILLLMG
jgi:hypothetical protein